MKKIIFIILIMVVPITSFALCTVNHPLCDVNFTQQQPIFLEDGWGVVGQRNTIPLGHDDRGPKPIKTNTPYTIRCLISMKNFVSQKDQENLNVLIGGTDKIKVDYSNITYIAWNTEGRNETALYMTHNTIPLHLADSYIYFKHVMITGDNSYRNAPASIVIESVRYPISYSCVAFEELNLMRN